VPLTFHALWLLCGLGTAACASAAVVYATGALRALPWIAIALGFAGGMYAREASGSIDASWVGGLTAAVAALELIRPGHYLVTGAAAGALAALWAGLLQTQGVPALVASATTAVIPMGSSLASLAAGNLEAMAGQMVVAFTTTIIGLATGTLAYDQDMAGRMRLPNP